MTGFMPVCQTGQEMEMQEDDVTMTTKNDILSNLLLLVVLLPMKP